MSGILTEDCVSECILSFGKEDFLFTGTVCRSWRKNSGCTGTHVKASVESVSRVKESFEYDICTDEAAFVAIEEGASISVFKAIYDRGFYWWDGVDLGAAVHLEVAATYGRTDVLEFLTPLGPLGVVRYDEKFLRKAVVLSKLENEIVEVVRFLLNTGCPIDAFLSGERSMEIAIKQENLDLIKALRTADYPFISTTFRTACETKNVAIVRYLHDEGCKPDEDLFWDLKNNDEWVLVEVLCRMGYGRDEWDLNTYLAFGRTQLSMFVLEQGVIPTDRCVDGAISGGDLGTAMLLTTKYSCRPTSQAYIELFNNDYVQCDAYNFRVLEWLHDEMGCDIGFSSFEEMKKEPHGRCIVDGQSKAIVDWFKNKLN